MITVFDSGTQNYPRVLVEIVAQDHWRRRWLWEVTVFESADDIGTHCWERDGVRFLFHSAVRDGADAGFNLETALLLERNPLEKETSSLTPQQRVKSWANMAEADARLRDQLPPVVGRDAGICKHCNKPIVGGKGDYWHKDTGKMSCYFTGPVAAPTRGHYR